MLLGEAAHLRRYIHRDYARLLAECTGWGRYFAWGTNLSTVHLIHHPKYDNGPALPPATLYMLPMVTHAKFHAWEQVSVFVTD